MTMPTDDEIEAIADDIRMALINLRDNPEDEDTLQKAQQAVGVAQMMLDDLSEA